MAYQVKRLARFTDELQLTADSGEVMMVIPVDLDIDRIAQDIYKRYFDVVHVQQELSKLQAEGGNDPKVLAAKMEALGNSIIALYSLLFGEENASQMLSFFEGNYTEMLTQTYPYLLNVIIPEIRTRAEARKKELTAKRYRKPWNR